jgi:hypothetical protein
LINADFGMGDTIQFWRFVPLAKDRVSHVYVRCDGDFNGLLTDADIVDKEAPLPPFDKIIHMMALPRALGVKKADISGKPYIKHPEGRFNPIWESCLTLGRGKRIGVCWNGNPFNSRDYLRSLPEEHYKDFVARSWIAPHGNYNHFYSLDKAFGPPSNSYIDCRDVMDNWNRTARLVSRLDLVISVDTAVAHLAGAMGVPVWNIVTTQQPDWRWGVWGEKTLWYDSMRLFRNVEPKKLMDDLVVALQGL